MTEEQWRAAWILCETAGDLTSDAQREYVQGTTVDPEVENHVIAVFEELESEPFYEPAPDRRVGDTVGRYTLVERIGQGGMGEVYAAEDTELRRTVALKFLPSAVAADKAAASQVISEARLASRLNHPNIVTVYELIQTSWGLAIAMEFVEGESLRTLLKSTKLTARRTLHIGQQLASALAAAHEKGIIHRDIKPENIMVRVKDDFVKVLDFSLAQNLRDHAAAHQQPHLPVGTVRYMSPEQKVGWPATAASDVYSLALVLEEANWRHPISNRMRSENPLQRPTAREVERLLTKLEAPSHKWLALALGLSLLLIALEGVYWFRSANEHAGLQFEQITHYSSGLDVTAAVLAGSGDQLAYTTIDNGFFLRDNRTHKVRELAGPEHLICHQLLFADAQRLLAIGSVDKKLEAWQIPLDSGTPQRLSENVQLAALSHDGKQIAWLNTTYQVWAGAALDSRGARLLMQIPRGVHVAALFWSGDDRQLWFHRLAGCRNDPDQQDVAVNPDLCESSDLVAVGPHAGPATLSVGPLWFSSGFFTSSEEFIFLRQDVARRGAGFNLWSLRINSLARHQAPVAKQISHLSTATFSNLTGTPDGRQMLMVRAESLAQTYTADWQRKPTPSLRLPLRLTFEQSYNFPHAWSADSQSVIFESGRNEHLEIFQQNRRRHEPEPLVSADRENYYPQLTPDGKWILFMSAQSSQDKGFSDFRLMRVPAGGGPTAEVPIGGIPDEFRCSVPGSRRICVLRTTQEGQQAYYELDPVRGKGRELGRTSFAILGLGRWALSADGRYVAIPDNNHPGSFFEMQLDPDSSKQRQVTRRISGIHRVIEGMNPGPFHGEWLAWADSESHTSHGLMFPLFSVDPSHLSSLYFVDVHDQAHLLENDSIHAFGVFSPDNKHVAAIRDELTSNVWSLVR